MRRRPIWSGNIIPAEVTIYQDSSFTFELKTPPTPDLLRKAAGVPKGSSVNPTATRLVPIDEPAVARDRRDQDEGSQCQ